MANKTLIYRLAELPDPAFPPFQLKSGGNVRAAIWADTLHLLRTLAEFPPGSAAVAIRWTYDPAAGREHPQRRLLIDLVGQAHSEGALLGLSLLLDRAPFHRFLRLERLDDLPAASECFNACCDVVRRSTVLEPTVTPEFNPKALPGYPVLESFQPNDKNDYLPLYTILDGIEEPVSIEICVEPADIRQELLENTRYLAQLQQINQTWDSEDEDWGQEQWSNDDKNWRPALKPLRHKDPLVDEVLRRVRRFHATLTQLHLRFHLRSWARTSELARLLASVLAESAFEEGSYQLVPSSQDEAGFGCIDPSRSLRAAPVPTVSTNWHDPEGYCFTGLEGLCQVAPVAELASAFRFPLPAQGSPPCCRKNTDPPFEQAEGLLVLGHDEQSSHTNRTRGNSNVPRGVLRKVLPKHMFISGMPGSGKTIASFNVLSQLAAGQVPFIVFECGKSEYRSLKCLSNCSDPDARRLAETLQIYTPGDDISPMRLNPLRIPQGISVHEHIENLLGCFRAAMPMSGSLPALLGEALEQAYEQHQDPDRPPRMHDLHESMHHVLASKGYSGDTDSDLRAAVDSRLGVLTRRAIGRVFQCHEDTPSVDSLMNGHSIIELANLPQEQGCLFTLFVLTAIYERVKSTPWSGDGMRLALVIEEAHNIVGRNTDAITSEDNADPKAHASALICRMLAELRSLGVSIIIIDQLPSAMAPEVLKNTRTKLACLQVDQENREALGAAMLFGPVEMEEIARLQPGEAFLFTEGYFGPRRIRTPNRHADWNLQPPPVGRAILPHIIEADWFVEAAETRICAEIDLLRKAMNRFEDMMEDHKRTIVRLVRQHPSIVSQAQSDQRHAQFTALARKARALSNQIQSSLSAFHRDSYVPLVGPHPGDVTIDEGLASRRGQLIKRFDLMVMPRVQSAMRVLDKLVHRCKVSI